MKKNKGFTMVELLAAVAILGLLTVMAFPTMRAIQGRNETRKYEEYGHSMLSAAKLYTDSYADDLFPRGYKNDFAKISTESLVQKDLLKNIGFTDVSCINGESFIVVAKYGDDYQYCLSMTCKNKAGVKVYEEINKEGICKTYDTRTVIYKYKPTESSAVREYPDKIIKGDDTYRAQDPAKFGNFDFDSNHQVFQSWKVENKEKTYLKGAVIDSGDLNGNLVLWANFRQYEYKINYSANGGTGSVSTPQKCYYDTNCKLRANGYTKTGYTFLNWKAGNGTTYNADTNYKNLVSTDGGSINLSANWRANRVYILYNANGASLATEHLQDFTIKSNLLYKNNDSKFFSVAYGESLGENGLIDYNNKKYVNLEKTGYKVTAKEEWNTKANGTGTSYDMSSQNYKGSTFCDATNGDCSKTLYTNWKAKTIKVTFNCNTTGASGGGNQTFTYDKTNQKFSKKCTKTGYTMTGWNSKADGSGNGWSTASNVSNAWIDKYSPSITLYAQWRKNKISIYYMANGGKMASKHDKSLTIKNDQVYKNGNIPIHVVEYGGKVDLCNYNYNKYLNIYKTHYAPPSGEEWNTKKNGSGTSYDQTKEYTTSQFCNIDKGDCNKTVYVNWEYQCDSSYPYQTSDNKCYNTLDKALDNVPNNGKIMLRKDFTDSSNGTLSTNKTVTFDLKGHTLTLSSYPLTVSTGKLTITTSVSTTGSIITKNNIVKVVNVTGGTLNINKITIHNQYATKATGHTIGLNMTGGTVNMSSGAIKAGTGSNSGHSLIVDNEGGVFNMSGGLLESNSTMSGSNGGHGGSGIVTDINTTKITGGTVHVIRGGLDRCLLCAHSGGKILAKGNSVYKWDGSVNGSYIFFYAYGSSSRICYESTVSLTFTVPAGGYAQKFSTQGGGTIENKSTC